MLLTNSEYLRPEIMDILRAFGCDNADMTHYFSYGGGKFYNCIEYLGNFYDFENEFKVEDDLTFKRFAKRFAKLAVYKVLSQTTGVQLPWGALTGIRPTKLAYAEIKAERSFEPLFEALGVKKENISLVSEVLKTQQKIYNAQRGGTDLFISLPFCPTKCEY
ncbi:MAG: hypothetical protein K2K28_00855, partial [Clostridia bacterium]|nr:hypothetical protein [Clostridia bacterium]